ncbi:MAG: SpoIVB peptidase [Ruminococcaceae bacterium]|nr:SpoIVB peptidase [Oscillospiraceae bacterium]
MKKANKIFKIIYIAIIWLIVILFLQINFYCTALPDNFFREKLYGESFSINPYPSVIAKPEGGALAAVSENERTQKMTLMLYGIFPIKDITVSKVDAPSLIPSGEPFGLKMLTDGVIVTDYGSVETPLGSLSPAKESGLQVGDIIVKVNNREINTGDELTKAVQKDGKEIKLTVIRKGETITLTVTPKQSRTDGLYKLGIWTRDSCAGIGTLTYYDPSNNSFGGLGHSVCDSDTGELLPLLSGEKVPVCINSVVKGVNGSPGELCGSFMSSTSSGSILLNTDCGVFGFSDKLPKNSSIPLGFKQDIEIGDAEIMTTVEGMTPKSYSITIEKVNYNSESSVKNMVIRITDKELLSKTGGIVQGMSGSPIIQNGRIVGAVTHVFVNDVTRGYGIFAENMYEFSSALDCGDDEIGRLSA